LLQLEKVTKLHQAEHIAQKARREAEEKTREEAEKQRVAEKEKKTIWIHRPLAIYKGVFCSNWVTRKSQNDVLV